jgi:hypothetical protein
MTPALLRAAGEALYGPRWQSELARELGVSDRTMRRWIAGDPIPELEDEIARLIAERRRRLAEVGKELGGAER